MIRRITSIIMPIIVFVGTLMVALPEAQAVTLPPALFISAHPDDETLAMGVAIAEHVAAGQDVHVLWLSDGESSTALGSLNGSTVAPWWGVRHVPAAEGYAPMSAADMAAARLRESASAVACLSAGLAGSLTVHHAHLPDGDLTVASVAAAIVAVADSVAPDAPVRLKAHTWRSDLDSHPDHLAVGQAVLALGTADPTRFADRRYYVLARSSVPAGVTIDSPSTADIRNRVINAARAYEAWQPQVGSYAIGGHSVGSTYLATLLNTPRSLYHA